VLVHGYFQFQKCGDPKKGGAISRELGLRGNQSWQSHKLLLTLAVHVQGTFLVKVG
jgi:hypothetical protein